MRNLVPQRFGDNAPDAELEDEDPLHPLTDEERAARIEAKKGKELKVAKKALNDIVPKVLGVFYMGYNGYPSNCFETFCEQHSLLYLILALSWSLLSHCFVFLLFAGILRTPFVCRACHFRCRQLSNPKLFLTYKHTQVHKDSQYLSIRIPWANTLQHRFFLLAL